MMMQTSTANSIIALDVGAKRVGVARASLLARLPEPLTTLENNTEIWQNLQAIVNDHHVGQIVVGLPRGLDGQATGQTQHAQDFAAAAREKLGLPIHFQDEAVTSKRAESELAARGKAYQKTDIDALAATYILEDFLNDKPKV